jgi:protein-tyrosine phosphatase
LIKPNRRYNSYRFAPAQTDEMTVFGASRPGYSDRDVQEWIAFMKAQGIQKVCCLLCDRQLARYSNLLDHYQQEFGVSNVCWAPVKDFHLIEVELLLEKILPFLATADRLGEKVVVHCSGGIGRTGQVMAAWLVFQRDFSNQAAINAVRQTGRNPYEFAIAALFQRQNPWQAARKLDTLLDHCRSFA